MAIQEKDYKDLKEYWDYQRKIQYNKECVYRMAEKFEGRAYNDFGPIHIDDVKTMLWDKIKSDEYDTDCDTDEYPTSESHTNSSSDEHDI